MIRLSDFVTDWSVDNKAALTKAMEACQVVDTGWASVASGARHSGGDAILLDVPEGEVLKLGSQVTVPAGRSIRFFAEVPRGRPGRPSSSITRPTSRAARVTASISTSQAGRG